MKPLNHVEYLLDRMSGLLTPEIAREIADYRYDAETQVCISELADKANEGILTVQERELYAQYIEVGDLIGIVKARSRKVVRREIS